MKSTRTSFYRILSALTLLALLVTACTNGGSTATAAPEPTVTSLPTAVVELTSVPDVEASVQSFLDRWQAQDYAGMYEMLSSLSRDAVSLEDFSGRYTNVALALVVTDLTSEILSVMTSTRTAQAAYRVTFTSSLIEQYTTSEMLMDLTLENGEWKVEWHDGLIMPQLRGGNVLRADISVPARGGIYDVNGNAFAAQTEAYAIGVEPGKIEKESTLLAELSRLLEMPTADIQAKYEYARGTNWYVALGDAPADAVEARLNVISGVGGVWLNNYDTRYYYAGESAAQVVGYVLAIPAEQLASYQAQGYVGNEQIGVSGIEKGAEEALRGVRGADVYVVSPEGQVLDRLGHTDARPSLSVVSTLDFDFQEQVERALSGKTGAIVVMERDTGRVLAMASNPSFNPNLFDPDNFNRNYLLEAMLNNTNQPGINRASQSSYPLGSVFKIITMAAALETGLYTADTRYMCGHTFTELEGQVFYDWTYEKEVAASGELTLQQGLMRSCNPYFYHIGLDLYRQNFPNAISEMAVGFGLGSPTGIGVLDESAGNVPSPTGEGDAVQLAIGQGTLLVTPLQVATFIAALGNGGTLYTPQLVDHYLDANGNIIDPFIPQTHGSLPISEENRQIIIEAMRWVTSEQRGTAYSTFYNLYYPVYGKTGTAQTSLEAPHSWFAGFTDANEPGKPDIAVVVFTEFAGEGSEVSAPIFRRVVELYFEGKAIRQYPWESRLWVTQTPTLFDAEYTQTAVQRATEESQRATEEAEQTQQAEGDGGG
ncbi:MAG: hypothetical protein HPY85_15695 [Anaerolineae bacterium]|nr:hypothetical protein [Anaerolineae bacterium]